MATYVVDTSVFLTAQGDANQMSPDCQNTALIFIRDLSRNHNLCLDQTQKIVREYRNKIPRLSFIDELINRMLSRNRIDFVPIEFDLAGDALLPNTCEVTDRSDRKFVAVALAHPAQPPIFNASDTDWLENEKELNACQVKITHLCERELRDQLAKKQAKGA